MSEYDNSNGARGVATARGYGWVPMSPDQVRRQTFPETSWGRRGYRPEDVDRFLNRVATELSRWNSACQEQSREVERLRNYFRSEGHEPDARSRDTSAEAISVLQRAQAHADQLIADAQAHARAMQHDARELAETIVGQAREQSDRAAQDYRSRSGSDYTADREQVERLAALSRSILGALSGASIQLDGSSRQIRAISDAFDAELRKLTAPGYPEQPSELLPPAPREWP